MNNLKENPFYDFGEISYLSGEEIICMYPIEGIIDIMPGYYYISSMGRLFSAVKEYIYEILPSFTADGYLQIKLLDTKGERHTQRINRLVCIYFNFRPDCKKLKVDHIDGNKTNNAAYNLRWVTHSENMSAALHNGLIKRTLSEDDIIFIKKALCENTMTTNELAKKYNISSSMILKIRRGESYNDIKTEYDDELESRKVKYKRLFDNTNEDLVVKIYNELKELNLTGKELAEKYNTSDNTIYRIKRLYPPYNTILAKYGITEPILDSIPKPNKFNEEEAINIYNDCKVMSINDIMNKYNCGKTLIFDIKLVRNKYSYLKDKYGLEPIIG